MKDEELFIDDRCIIPDFIKKMTPEELDEYIRMKEEQYAEKRKMLREKLGEEEINRRIASVRDINDKPEWK